MKAKTHKQFLSEISGRGLIPTTPYVGALQKMGFRCDVDGHQWDAYPSNILRGSGCPECGKKVMGEKHRKKNEVLEDHGDWVLLDVSTEKYPRAVMMLDKEDLHLLTHRARASRNGYVKMFTGKHRRCVHQLINPQYRMTDHRDRDPLNNRRENLREATASQNNQNKGLRKHNTSGATGVSRDRNRWRAEIDVGKKSVYLGTFKDKEEAIEIRRLAEVKHFGEFRCQG